jgi:hypothetical protein
MLGVPCEESPPFAVQPADVSAPHSKRSSLHEREWSLQEAGMASFETSNSRAASSTSARALGHVQ